MPNETINLPGDLQDALGNEAAALRQIKKELREVHREEARVIKQGGDVSPALAARGAGLRQRQESLAARQAERKAIAEQVDKSIGTKIQRIIDRGSPMDAVRGLAAGDAGVLTAAGERLRTSARRAAEAGNMGRARMLSGAAQGLVGAGMRFAPHIALGAMAFEGGRRLGGAVAQGQIDFERERLNTIEAQMRLAGVQGDQFRRDIGRRGAREAMRRLRRSRRAVGSHRARLDADTPFFDRAFEGADDLLGGIFNVASVGGEKRQQRALSLAEQELKLEELQRRSGSVRGADAFRSTARQEILSKLAMAGDNTGVIAREQMGSTSIIPGKGRSFDEEITEKALELAVQRGQEFITNRRNQFLRNPTRRFNDFEFRRTRQQTVEFQISQSFQWNQF